MVETHDRPAIEILLATYNGARFLAEQLDSLLAQDQRDFTVLASDDGSSDATPAILEQYASAHPGLLKILPPAAERLGPSGNFSRLIDASSADYVFFCDQDDVWLPWKVSASLAKMAEAEAQHGRDMPIIVHTDLEVVDDRLNTLGASFMGYTGIDPGRNWFGALLLSNVVTGCTSLANRALYELARPIPKEASMFDRWLALVAAGMGKIVFLDAATVRYRQHGGNAIGARRAGTASFLTRVERTLLSDKVLKVLSIYTEMAAVLAARFGDRLRADHLCQAKAFAGIWKLPRYKRFASLARAGLFKATLTANLGILVLLMRDGRPERFAKSK